MEPSILRLHFSKSRSKFYKQAINLAKEFNEYEIGEVNMVALRIKEIFEKWEFFNLLFWRVVDWKGTTLTFDGMSYQSHCDKTRIFYAVQQAHSCWMSRISHLFSKLDKVYVGEATLEELKIETETEYDIDRILDDFAVMMARKKYHEEYGDLDFMNPNELSQYKKTMKKT